MVDFFGNDIECDNLDLATGGGVRTRKVAGNTTLFEAYDVDGAAYKTFATLTANNTPTMDLDDAVTKSGGYIYRAGGTAVASTDGGTGLATYASGDLIYASAVDTLSALNAGTDGYVLTLVSGLPSWQPGGGGGGGSTAFQAYLSTTIPNVTGAGTYYNIVWDAVKFDKNSDFNTTTGVFTVPATAIYQLSIRATVFNLTSVNIQANLWLTINGAPNAFPLMFMNPGTVIDATDTASFTFAVSSLQQFTAADTVQVGIFINGGISDSVGMYFGEFSAVSVA